MPVFSKSAVTVLFVHVPKTGGSTVEDYLVRNGWECEFSIRGRPLNELSYLKTSPQHFHADILKTIFDMDEFDAIYQISRDPLARLKSEYYWQLKQDITRLGPRDWLLFAFDRFGKNPFVFDNHLRCQWEFAVDTTRSSTYKLEAGGVKKVIAEMEKLTSRFKMRSKLNNLFRDIRKVKQSKKDVAIDAAFDDNIDLVREIYWRDYEKYGY